MVVGKAGRAARGSSTAKNEANSKRRIVERVEVSSLDASYDRETPDAAVDVVENRGEKLANSVRVHRVVLSGVKVTGADANRLEVLAKTHR